METPHIDHLSANDFNDVYEPAEDSFLLLDALEADLMYLKQLQPNVCLEIGSGSGVIITALSKVWPNSSLCLSTDVNEFACRATRRTAQRNTANVDVIRSNLLDGIRPNCVDLMVFNPPYVITSVEEIKTQQLMGSLYSKTSRNIIPSWAGGQNGRQIIDELLTNFSEKLTLKGVFYLLVLRENKPDEIIDKLAVKGFYAIKFMERRIPGEYLYILKIKRKEKVEINND